MEECLIIRYRKHASYCRVKAARAPEADHKARWLEFAEEWEMLADEASQEAGVRRPAQIASAEPLPRRLM
jgi:hypothetical protein